MPKLPFSINLSSSECLQENIALTPDFRDWTAFDPATTNLMELDYWSATETFTQAKYLALMILPIQEIATQVAYDAMLSAQVCRNKQYSYRKGWLKNNRYKKYGPTKALLHKNQLVQNFVYREIEKYEKYTEGDLNQPINHLFEDLLKAFHISKETLIVRYIKFLIQIAEDNSANAILAITKLIYKYRTIDVAEIYTRLHGDGPADNYFSKRKGDFMKRLEERFQTLINQEVLKVCVGNKRERYFQGQEKFNSQWAGFVNQSLNSFVPWGTSCLQASTETSFIENFFNWVERIFNQDQKKLVTIHTLFCPHCFEKLTKELNVGKPSQLLALPDFNIQDNNLKMVNHPSDSIVEKAEVKQVLNKLNNENLRRQKMKSEGIKHIFVLVDNTKIADIDFSKTETVEAVIEDDSLHTSKMLKFYSVDREGDLLLATVVLQKKDFSSFFSSLSQQKILILDGVEKLFLSISYHQDTGEKGKYFISLEYKKNVLAETTIFLHEYSTIMKSVWLK